MVEPSPRDQDERPGFLFYVIVAAAAFYLLVRLGQGVIWVVERL